MPNEFADRLSRHLPRAVPPDFTNKMAMAVEEADESEFWLPFVGQAGINQTADQQELLAEAGELLAIFAKSAKTASDTDNQK